MKKLIPILAVIALALSACGSSDNKTSSSPSSSSNGPKTNLVTANFVAPSAVSYISKFRSNAGHDFSDMYEQCRSMKHYFAPALGQGDSRNGMPPAPDGVHDVVISAPFDGTIEDIATEQMPIGKQFYISAKANPDFVVRLFHVYPDNSIKKGMSVKAGDRLGVISGYQQFDVSAQFNVRSNESGNMGNGNGSGVHGKLVSVFSMMDPTTFGAWNSRGLTSLNQIVIPKSTRDASPLVCQGQQFQAPNNDFNDTDTWFKLS